MIRYREPDATVDAIPVISLDASGAQSEERRRQLGSAIGHACRTTGFFYLIDHGLTPSLLRRQLEMAQAFFVQPLDEKLRCTSVERGQRGYEPIAAQALDEGSPPDLKESILLGPEPGDWPPLPDFEETLSSFFAAISDLGRAVACALAVSLDLPETYFEAMLEHPNCTVRMLHYPPHPDAAADNQIGAGAHTDWGFLTLLLQDDIGGLEVQGRDGRWIRAEPVENAIVVNLGDMVPYMTGGLYTSNFHRVMNNRSGRDRYSIATFFNPPTDAIITCVPSCRPADGAPASMTVGEHIQRKIAETYGAGAG